MSATGEPQAPEEPTPATLAVLMQQGAEGWLAARDIHGWSFAVHVTDGDKPGAGTTVAIRSGRYADSGEADVLNPDIQAAYEERTRIREAIVQWVAETEPGSDQDHAIEALTDDIVAALAGE